MRNRNTEMPLKRRRDVLDGACRLLVAATLTLAGCAVGPQYTKPEITAERQLEDQRQ